MSIIKTCCHDDALPRKCVVRSKIYSSSHIRRVYSYKDQCSNLNTKDKNNSIFHYAMAQNSRSVNSYSFFSSFKVS